MAAETRLQKGFQVHCPLCGEEDSLRINVDDVHNLTCSRCDGDLTADDIREVMAQWQRLLTWLETAPAYGAED